MRDLIAEWQPPLVVWVDPNPYGIEEIRRVSPRTFIVGRKFEEGGWNSPNLKERAYYWADQCIKMGPCDAYYAWNEPISHDDTANFGRLDDYHMWFRECILARTRGYIEAVGLNIATGNFTKLDNIAECFPKTCATFRHLGIHEYDWIIDPARRPVDADRLGYYWNRWPHWLEDIGRDDVTLWLTECGMTQAVHWGRPDEGWRSGADGMTDDDYVTWADWYNRQLVQDTRIGGAALFNFAGWGWGTFEHLGWERLDEILALDAPEPNGGNGMDIKIYDFDHGPGDAETVDWQWVLDTFGDVQIRAIEDKEGLTLQDGDVVYKLVYLDARLGDANIIINVRDEDGNPVQDETVMFGWPDAPAHGYPSKPSNWTGIGVPGPTNANGDVGPGLGKGAYYSPAHGERGGHFVWVYGLPSDYVDGLGMLAGTNHAHLNLGYRAVRVEENGNGGEGMWKETSRTFTSGASRIILHCSGGNLFDTRGDMKCGSWRLPEEVHPVNGVFTFDTTYDKDENRTYVAWIYRLPGRERVSEEVACDFGPGQRGTYDIYLEWDENGNGPTPPIPDDIAALIKHVKAEVGQDVKIAEVKTDGSWMFGFYESH
jgi:hypothetical protein